ncbi:XdhC family protein [Rhizobium sp. E27B/91]|nr:XdhC family protein [Rhizobium sp. E27B/91]
MLSSCSVTAPIVPKKALMTDDAIKIMEFAAQSLDAGHEVALATLVDIRGGSAHPLGSHMAIRDDGFYCGFVSGGCTEAAVASEAMEAISRGCDRNLLLGEGSPFFDIVLPCGGGITVAIHVLRESVALWSILARLGKRLTASLCYQPDTQRLIATETFEPTGWRGQTFITHHRPRVRVVLAGRSVEADVTARVATAAGYDVYCYDGSGPALSPEIIDADTAVSLLYHDIEFEIPVFEAVLRSRSFYVGALGSARTHARRVQRLEELGYSRGEIARIKSPIGLFNKARDSQSLALSVLADIAARRLLEEQ